MKLKDIKETKRTSKEFQGHLKEPRKAKQDRNNRPFRFVACQIHRGDVAGRRPDRGREAVGRKLKESQET